MSVASEEEATNLVSQLGILLQNRGFRLTKWLSNIKEGMCQRLHGTWMK